MVELSTQKDIEKISMDLLTQAKALDIFPTPIDRIVRTADLVVDGTIDLSAVSHPFMFKVSDTLMSGWNKVRGFLDRSEKIIYLDLQQLPTRQNFVKLHEVGHQVLPWQREVMQYLDNDDTLSFTTREEFEAEANYFSSLTLFQQDRFMSEMGKLELNMKSGMMLGKKFGGSVHASLRRMVEQSNKRCALLVLKKNENSMFPYELPECGKKDLFQSKKFTEEFGEIYTPDQFGYEWTFVQDFMYGRKYHEGGEVVLNTDNGPTTFIYHFFNNTYNGFVFLLPEGECQSSRTKILIRSL